MIRNLQEGPNPVNVQETTFTLDNMGRFLCNTLQEAFDSTTIQVAGKQRSFDTIVIGGGTFGAAIAASLLFADTTHSRRILVLEAGPFALPEHNQNMPYQGGTPDFRKPWDSHPALAYQGLLFAVGGFRFAVFRHQGIRQLPPAPAIQMLRSQQQQ